MSSSGSRTRLRAARCSPSKRYRVGSATTSVGADPLASRFVEEHCRRDADVERADPSRRAESRHTASHVRRTSGRTPLPSAPSTSATPPERSAVHTESAPSASAAYTHSSGPLISARYRARFETTAIGRCSIAPADAFADRGCDAHRAVRGHDDSARARPLGAADDRAEVVRVGDLVETDQQWHVARPPARRRPRTGTGRTRRARPGGPACPPPP